MIDLNFLPVTCPLVLELSKVANEQEAPGRQSHLSRKHLVDSLTLTISTLLYWEASLIYFQLASHFSYWNWEI